MKWNMLKGFFQGGADIKRHMPLQTNSTPTQTLQRTHTSRLTKPFADMCHIGYSAEGGAVGGGCSGLG